MTEITPVVEIPQGDTRRLPFSVTQPDGSAQDLSGATIEWRLGDESAPALSTADSGVGITKRDDAAGTFTVELSSVATETLTPQTYDEVLTIEDSAGNVTQFAGHVTIFGL